LAIWAIVVNVGDSNMNVHVNLHMNVHWSQCGFKGGWAGNDADVSVKAVRRQLGTR